VPVTVFALADSGRALDAQATKRVVGKQVIVID
jgi:hypothetical protein